jgi:hypothetical protein
MKRHEVLGFLTLAVMLSACGQNGASLPGSSNAAFNRGIFERSAQFRNAATTAKLYVSDPIGNAVEVYDVAGKNQQPVAKITDGISGPGGMAVDGKGDLYVANTTGNTITEYASGGSSPVATYSDDLIGPVDVAVDSKGTVYVANFYVFAWSIVEFPAGSTAPSLEIHNPGSAYSVGVTVSTKDKLYASFQNFYSLPSVYVYAPGSTQGVAVLQSGPPPLGCDTQQRCLLAGLLIDKSNNLLVADGTLPGVEVFPPGKTKPSTILGKTGSPQFIAFASSESEIFVTDTLHSAVEEYSYPGGTLLNTIKSGLKSVYGVSVGP